MKWRPFKWLIPPPQVKEGQYDYWTVAGLIHEVTRDYLDYKANFDSEENEEAWDQEYVDELQRRFEWLKGRLNYERPPCPCQFRKESQGIGTKKVGNDSPYPARPPGGDHTGK